MASTAPVPSVYQGTVVPTEIDKHEEVNPICPWVDLPLSDDNPTTNQKSLVFFAATSALLYVILLPFMVPGAVVGYAGNFIAVVRYFGLNYCMRVSLKMYQDQLNPNNRCIRMIIVLVATGILFPVIFSACIPNSAEDFMIDPRESECERDAGRVLLCQGRSSLLIILAGIVASSLQAFYLYFHMRKFGPQYSLSEFFDLDDSENPV